jgi:divalent metal cation (Fe/Co/Zn/Cd) transporter
MSATTGVDVLSMLGGIGAWLSSFFNTLVQYAPLIITVTVAGFLIYKYSSIIRRSIAQLLGLF